MFDKSKREQRHEQEDAIFNKMLLCLAGAVIVELLFLLIKNIYINALLGGAGQVALIYFFQAYNIVGIVLTAAGIAWAVMTYRKRKPVWVPVVCTAVVAVLWVMSVFAIYLMEIGMNIMMILPAAAAALIVVFFLYQRIFFFNATVAAGGLVALWLHRQYYTDHPKMIIVFFAAGFVLLAAALAVSFLLRSGDGRLGSLRVVPAGTSYVGTWITCGVTALTMALALVLGTAAGYYLLFGLVAWVFIEAVFFTVKLM